MSSVCACGKEKKFRSLGEGYRTYCSPACRKHSKRYSIANRGRKQTVEHIQRRLVKINQASKEEKRRKTCLARYGEEHISRLSFVQAKQRNTSYKRYGVRNPQQSGLIGSSNYRDFEISGRRFRIQGYEDLFLRDLERYGFNVQTIVCGKAVCPSFTWVDDKGKERRYFPDFFDKQSNTIIEVKSTWTYDNNVASVHKKMKAAFSAKYNVLCVIYHSRSDFTPRVLSNEHFCVEC